MTNKRKNDEQHSETPQKIIKSLSELDSFTIFDILELNNDITILSDDMITEYDDIELFDMLNYDDKLFNMLNDNVIIHSDDIELFDMLNDDDFLDIFINLII